LEKEKMNLKDLILEVLEEGFDKEKKQGLRGWFSRNKGKGWIDCKTGKPCGRQKGEKRRSLATK
jgi:hypothetical protein